MWSVYYQDGTQEEGGAQALRNKNTSIKTEVLRKCIASSKLVRIKHKADRGLEIYSLYHGWTPIHGKIGLQGDMIMAFFEGPLRGASKPSAKICGRIYPDACGASLSRGGLIAWDNGQTWVRETTEIDERKAIKREIVPKFSEAKFGNCFECHQGRN
jgi:hypothetical protein